MVSARLMECCMFASLAGLVSIAAMYLFLFKKPPTEVIMANNKLKSRHRSAILSLALLDKDVSKMNAVEFARAKWDAWVAVNEHVSIGEVYDSCDKKKQLMVGRVIMLKDPKTDGLISRVITNVTYDHDITGGEVHIRVLYNGRLLYAKHGRLCHMEDDLEESQRVISCPIKAGKHKYFKDFPINEYLPKGIYQTKYWAYDQNGKDIGCTSSEFTL